MRLFTGLIAAVAVAAAWPAVTLAQAVGYELAPAPAAARGQVVEAGGVKTFTAENGWYTMTLGPDDTTDLDKNIRFFTYGANSQDHYVDIGVATDGIGPDDEVLNIADIEQNMGEMIAGDEMPSFTEGVTVTERKIISLGSGNGKQPMQFALWVGKRSDQSNAITVIGGTLLPKGSLMVIIDADNEADAEAALSEHLRIAAGVLE